MNLTIANFNAFIKEQPDYSYYKIVSPTFMIHVLKVSKMLSNYMGSNFTMRISVFIFSTIASGRENFLQGK